MHIPSGVIQWWKTKLWEARESLRLIEHVEPEGPEAKRLRPKVRKMEKMLFNVGDDHGPRP
jgi:hypothetical protein